MFHAQANAKRNLQRMFQVQAAMIDPAFQIGAKSFRPGDIFKNDMRSLPETLIADVFDEFCLDNVVMLFQSNPRARLLNKTRHRPFIFQEARLKRLDRYRAAGLKVIAQVNDAYSAANNISDLVAISQNFAPAKITRVLLFRGLDKDR